MHVYANVCLYVCLKAYMCVCMYVCTYVCMFSRRARGFTNSQYNINRSVSGFLERAVMCNYLLYSSEDRSVCFNYKKNTLL